mmetsp:Transcript_13044/g.18467  ORF Transcript_13044/g.18467 Transcript_13044/m.18467 type:complete len:669 (+) Transcript_13044:156-2162(+)
MDKLARKPRGRQRGKLAFVIITLGALNIYISVSVSLTSSQVKDVFSNLSISLPDYGKRSLINKSLLAAAKKDYLSALSKVALSAHLEEITSKNALLPKEQHIVFIGDSLLRYSFLEWLDQKHFLRQEREYAPPELINEKFSSSWLSYFNSSTNHFQGNLYCDCRRSQNFSLNSEIENRYYLTDALWATYLQGYGDNMAHGRFLPLEANSSVISPADGPDKDTSHCKWGYMGEDWDKMISDYVSKFQQKPTAIVLNAGLWPNEGIRNNLGNILRASRDVMGDKGVVIWRGMTKMRDSIDASPSSSDVTARDWSYRLPWFLYQPFPKLNLSASDYMDDKHFSAPNVYRDWNVDLLRGIASAETPMHRVFILVGAVRTLSLTAKSILQNLIYPICSPPSCIAHLVHHLSFWDNRPSSMNNDPTGTIITSDLTNTTQEQFFDEWTDVFPDGFLVFHKVDGYNIGSPEEQAAMDTLEREMDPLVSTRMRLFRTGDPRRYSYWIARAWAWRHTQQLSKTLGIEFDFYTFARPDLLWMVPVSTKQFFDDFKTNEREAWVHDTYLGHIADTFAFLPNYESADIYFSIPPLLEGKVACLGGPDFNKTLVTSRLTNEKINFTEIDFCTGGYEGWSEQILQRKLKFSTSYVVNLPVFEHHLHHQRHFSSCYLPGLSLSL